MNQNTEVNGQIKIEKGVPIPTERNSIRAVVKKMKTGESIVVTERQRGAVFAAAYGLKMKMTSRGLEGNAIRVWRIG